MKLCLIVASGAHYREIDVKGEKEFRGRGVSYCGVCDGPFFKGKTVLVVGGGNSACTTSLYLSGLASEVIIVHRRDAFRAEEAIVKDIFSKPNIKVFWNTIVKEIKGDRFVSSVTFHIHIQAKPKKWLLMAFLFKLVSPQIAR